MVVFLSTQDMVDFHYQLFRHFFGGDENKNSREEEELDFFRLHGDMEQKVTISDGEKNGIDHHIGGGMRESHPSVQDLQSTTRLTEAWMLQILDIRMGFFCPSRNKTNINKRP